MNFIEKIKLSIVKKSISNRKKRFPFNQDYSEKYQLPEDADFYMNNSYYFSGHDQQGNSLLFRLGKRNNGRNEVWFAVKDLDGSFFFNIKQTYNCNLSDDITDSCISASAECIEAGKKWAFRFSGVLSDAVSDPDKTAVSTGRDVESSFEGIFTASNNIFEFSRHMDNSAITRSIAMERWSKSFFANLKENHQVHYEQTGEIKGELTLNGKKKEIKLKAVRDHSYGKRDWNYMDRHIWLMALMEDGTALNISMVRYPAINELQSGYFISGNVADSEDDPGIYSATNKKPICLNSVTPMDEIECSGGVPQEFDLNAKMADGRILNILCKKEIEYIFPFEDGAYTIHEGIGSFTFGGIKGRGILEFGFNKDRTRWLRRIKQYADI